ncbi:MAG: hypothetical protein O8C61_05080 [Candidatus Methanoperedens sp.]|nr:hypothetical protein [Candidatus Methanoperedens sp.]
MPLVCADLTEIEFEILKNLKDVEGDEGEKLKNLLKLYIYTTPELKSSAYALTRSEKNSEIQEHLQDVYEAYEKTDYPTENWSDETINKLSNDLIETNVLIRLGERQFLPSSKFRNLFKMLLHDIVTEKEIDEYSGANIATIQLLMEFGKGSFSKEIIRDGTIFINEGWMFTYATEIKKAREFMKTKKLFPGIDVPAAATA